MNTGTTVSTIGIIGAGQIGQAFARLAQRAGRAVVIANSRGPETLAPVVARLGTGVAAGTIDEAAASAMVVLAVPWMSIPAAVGGLVWSRTIVIDATNATLFPDLKPAELYLRAAAASAFMPIMQYHSGFNHHQKPLRGRTHWHVADTTGDPTVVSVFRRFAQLRERLVDYLVEQARHAVATDAPLMRPLFFDPGDDVHIWAPPAVAARRRPPRQTRSPHLRPRPGTHACPPATGSTCGPASR